jgi:glycosyltransferase involved in cell wall biosynthesis
MSRITIISDAWHPQINGVVRSIVETNRQLAALGHQVTMITPQDFASVACPTYPDIRLSLAWPGKVAKLIKASRPDYLHIATEGPIGLMARRYCRRHKLAFTTSFHTRFPEYVAARAPVPLSWLYGFMRWFHNGGQTCMVATPSLEAELRAKGFNHLRRWSRGIDLSRFYPRPKSDRPYGLQRPIFISIGRLAPEKNLEAFLALDLPGRKLVVGDGPSRAQLQADYPEVYFTGTLEGDALAEAYSEADVFVFPSVTDTFGNVILEALASGVDIITFESKAGALNTDLRKACLDALSCQPSDALRHAQNFTWENATKQFVSNTTSAVHPQMAITAEENEAYAGREGLQI